MLVKFINLGGYGVFVWPAFIFTFMICLTLYLRTKKEFLKQEKIFIKEFQRFQTIKIDVDKRKETKEEALPGSII